MRAHLVCCLALAACVEAPPPKAPPCPTCPAPVACPTAPATPVVVSPPEPPPPPPLPPVPPAAFRDALARANAALAKNDFAAADKALSEADADLHDDPHLAYLAARVRATRFALAADFDHAAKAFGAVIPTLVTHPELADEFWAHNAMMMIRAAQGDPAAALAENDQATLAAARGTWNPEQRATLAFQKDRWHRAYLTRMLAESRTGSAKAALVAYAEAALADYRPTGYPEAVAVLEAYFAALAGKKDEALAAAKKIDPTKDDDVEDLYLVVVGLEAGGDKAGAESVRHVMRQPGAPSYPRAIMLRWLDLDQKPRPVAFTPLHAKAR